MIQLYINNQEVDIDRSVGLYLTKQFETISNPTLYHSDFSKTITLPMTAKNKRIFLQYNRQDSLVTNESIDPRVKIPYILLYNSELVMDGYLKINNANTVFKDNRFEVELNGTFGMVMNEFAQLTFNKYECETNGGTKDDKYFIPTPWQDILVNATLVKRSFEQESHNLNGNDILDYIKFIPTYQGKYPDFASDKCVIHPDLMVIGEMTHGERDEHYMREFRSYYQQPAIWVDKLWKLAKQKIDEITDYTLELDPSWFNQHNPYWTKLLYTCPSLYNKDENFVEKTTVFQGDTLHYKLNITEMSALSNHHKSYLQFTPNNDVMYRNGIFNPDLKGPSTFTMNSSIMFLAKKMWNDTPTWARIRKVNPLFVTFNVINADTGSLYDSHRYMVYSHSWKNTFNNWYDEKINAGITSSNNPNISGTYPMGFTKYAGWWWEAPINLEFQVEDNIRYRIEIDVRFGNNSKAVAYSHFNDINLMLNLWFYQTQLPGGSGYTIFNVLRNATCSTLDYTRSRSNIDLYRVFPKDTTLMSVLLNYSKKFGLMWDIDKDNKKITVMTRNRFFTGHRVLDWTDKIDRSRDFILNPLCFEKRYISFNVEEGKGQRYETYHDKYGVGYGSKKIDTEYQFSSDTDEFFKDIQPAIISQKAQFSMLYNTDDPNADNFVGYNAKVYPNEKYLENDKEGENAGNSGAFVFCNGTFTPDPQLGFKQSENAGYVLVSDDTETMKKRDTYCWNMQWVYGMTSANGCLKCTKLPAINTVCGSYSTDFERPAEYYTTGNYSSVRYVYDLYWKNFIDERYSVQNKKLTCYVYLTPQEYSEINFRDFVKIGNTLYHINKITDYDFDTNSPTRCELCQVWDVTAYTHGQDAWPALAAVPDSTELFRNDSVQIGVYSTSEWTVQSKPNWVTYTKDEDHIYLRATSDPLHTRSGQVVLHNEQNLTATIDVYQQPDNLYLILSKTSATVSGDGAVVNVDIDSRPTTVTVQSKPYWVNVSFQPHHLLEPITNLQDPTVRLNLPVQISKMVTKMAIITVNPTNRPMSRTGNIVFTNGAVTKTFVITQLGRPIIFEDYDCEPMHIELQQTGLWQLTTNKQIDPDTVVISSLGTATPPNKSISYLPISFTPELDPVDHGDGCPETRSSGGMITILREDGIEINKNYNYGYVTPSHEIWVELTEGGHFTSNDVHFHAELKETCDEGSVYELEAIPDSDSIFIEWSDGVQTAARTVVVESDVHIWPIFEIDRSYLYDNTDKVEYDNTETVDY